MDKIMKKAIRPLTFAFIFVFLLAGLIAFFPAIDGYYGQNEFGERAEAANEKLSYTTVTGDGTRLNVLNDGATTSYGATGGVAFLSNNTPVSTLYYKLTTPSSQYVNLTVKFAEKKVISSVKLIDVVFFTGSPFYAGIKTGTIQYSTDNSNWVTSTVNANVYNTSFATTHSNYRTGYGGNVEFFVNDVYSDTLYIRFKGSLDGEKWNGAASQSTVCFSELEVYGSSSAYRKETSYTPVGITSEGGTTKTVPGYNQDLRVLTDGNKQKYHRPSTTDYTAWVNNTTAVNTYLGTKTYGGANFNSGNSNGNEYYLFYETGTISEKHPSRQYYFWTGSDRVILKIDLGQEVDISKVTLHGVANAGTDYWKGIKNISVSKTNGGVNMISSVSATGASHVLNPTDKSGVFAGEKVTLYVNSFTSRYIYVSFDKGSAQASGGCGMSEIEVSGYGYKFEVREFIDYEYGSRSWDGTFKMSPSPAELGLTSVLAQGYTDKYIYANGSISHGTTVTLSDITGGSPGHGNGYDIYSSDSRVFKGYYIHDGSENIPASNEAFESIKSKIIPANSPGEIKVTVDGQKTVYLIYETKYTVEYDLAGGEGSVETRDYAWSDTVTLPNAPSKEGYKFNGWLCTIEPAPGANNSSSCHNVTYDAGTKLSKITHYRNNSLPAGDLGLAKVKFTAQWVETHLLNIKIFVNGQEYTSGNAFKFDVQIGNDSALASASNPCGKLSGVSFAEMGANCDTRGSQGVINWYQTDKYVGFAAGSTIIINNFQCPSDYQYIGSFFASSYTTQSIPSSYDDDSAIHDADPSLGTLKYESLSKDRYVVLYFGKKCNVQLKKNNGTNDNFETLQIAYGTLQASLRIGMPKPSVTPSRLGYSFVGYFDAATGGNQYYDENLNATRAWDKTADTLLYAHWVPNNYIVKFDANGGVGNMANQSFTYGVAQNLSVNTYTRDGYRFSGWSTSKDATSRTYSDGQSVNNLTGSLGGTVTLYAVWVRQIEITINVSGNGTVDKMSFKVDYGSSVSVSGNRLTVGDTVVIATASSGSGGYSYAFSSWSKQDGTITTATTITANFTRKAISYSIKYIWNGGSPSSGYTAPSSFTVESATIMLPTADKLEKLGYTFAGWYANSAFSGTALTQIPQGSIGDVELHAKWIANTYSITFHLDGGAINSGNITSYTYGKGATLPSDVTKDGYLFEGWYTKQEGGTRVVAIATNDWGNKEYYARWKINAYRVELVTYGGVVIGNGLTSYVPGVGATLPTEVVRTGFVFDGWYTNPQFAGSKVLVIATTDTGDKTFYAKWIGNIYKVTLITNGGTINEGAVTEYTCGVGAVLPTSVTREGFRFTGWYNNASCAGTPIVQIPSTSVGDKTFYAGWAESSRPFNVTLVKNGGNGGPNSVIAHYGEMMPTIEMPTRTNYFFAGYYDGANGVGTCYYDQNGNSVNVWDKFSDGTLYAYWLRSYTVTFDNQGGVGGTNMINVAFGREMPSINTPTKAGYLFGGYYDGTNGTGNRYYNAKGESVRPWDKMSNATLYAYWREDPSITPTYTVSFDQNGGNGGQTAALVAKYGAAMPYPAGATRVAIPTKQNFIFGGYNENADGSGKYYYSATGYSVRNYDKNANMILYAVWIDKIDPIMYSKYEDEYDNGKKDYFVNYEGVYAAGTPQLWKESDYVLGGVNRVDSANYPTVPSNIKVNGNYDLLGRNYVDGYKSANVSIISSHSNSKTNNLSFTVNNKNIGSVKIQYNNLTAKRYVYYALNTTGSYATEASDKRATFVLVFEDGTKLYRTAKGLSSDPRGGFAYNNTRGDAVIASLLTDGKLNEYSVNGYEFGCLDLQEFIDIVNWEDKKLSHIILYGSSYSNIKFDYLVMSDTAPNKIDLLNFNQMTNQFTSDELTVSKANANAGTTASYRFNNINSTTEKYLYLESAVADLKTTPFLYYSLKVPSNATVNIKLFAYGYTSSISVGKADIKGNLVGCIDLYTLFNDKVSKTDLVRNFQKQDGSYESIGLYISVSSTSSANVEIPYLFVGPGLFLDGPEDQAKHRSENAEFDAINLSSLKPTYMNESISILWHAQKDMTGNDYTRFVTIESYGNGLNYSIGNTTSDLIINNCSYKEDDMSFYYIIRIGNVTAKSRIALLTVDTDIKYYSSFADAYGENALELGYRGSGKKVDYTGFDANYDVRSSSAVYPQITSPVREFIGWLYLSSYNDYDYDFDWSTLLATYGDTLYDYIEYDESTFTVRFNSAIAGLRDYEIELYHNIDNPVLYVNAKTDETVKLIAFTRLKEVKVIPDRKEATVVLDEFGTLISDISNLSFNFEVQNSAISKISQVRYVWQYNITKQSSNNSGAAPVNYSKGIDPTVKTDNGDRIVKYDFVTLKNDVSRIVIKNVRGNIDLSAIRVQIGLNEEVLENVKIKASSNKNSAINAMPGEYYEITLTFNPVATRYIFVTVPTSMAYAGIEVYGNEKSWVTFDDQTVALSSRPDRANNGAIIVKADYKVNEEALQEAFAECMTAFNSGSDAMAKYNYQKNKFTMSLRCVVYVTIQEPGQPDVVITTVACDDTVSGKEGPGAIYLVPLFYYDLT